MTMDKLFDGSDAHLLPGNAELIERLRHNAGRQFVTPSILCEAADALEAADKRIAELEASVEQWKCNSRENKMIAESSERKLAVAMKMAKEG